MPVAKFTFTLEPLLKARQLQEQHHQRAFAEIERERIALHESLRAQQQSIAIAKQSMRNELVGQIDTSSLRMHAASSMSVMRKAQRVVLELAGVHRKSEAARAALVESMRSRRAVELLKERRFEQWKSQIEQMENAAIDELAIIAAARKKSLEPDAGRATE